jgi:tetratricopeptide (TPR) repeat protein
MSDCRQALELARTAGDAIAEATSCDSLGFVHHQLGEHRTAADYYETALDLRRILGHRSGEASTLTKLGATRAELGELGAALRTWRSALLLLEQLGEPADRVRAELRRLGDRALNTVD